ncbi:MAG: exodeoxyribonuclease VII small subunit [Oscillospiraceae bacterium]|nr:exodeoxyribonuclease VII small subunit [Oscillospiraceae bacterium]
MPTKKQPTFEEAMSRLETIVSRLEKGDLPLEEALALFEEGAGLMKQCSKALDQAEQKVAKLLPGAGGLPQEEPMEEMEV